MYTSTGCYRPSAVPLTRPGHLSVGGVALHPRRSALTSGSKLSSCRNSSGSKRPAKQPTCQAVQTVQPAISTQPTQWYQKVVTLPLYKRGCHVVTREVLKALPEISDFDVGLANFFVQHTSASLTINENASPDVPLDLNDSLDRIVPEGRQYRHLDEGLDDMPAHVKSSLMGASLTIPIRQGRLALGIWQGLYLNEHRNYGGARSLVVTIQGQRRADGRTYSSYS